MISRRTFVAGLGTGLLPARALYAQEAPWPTKPVRIIVPNVPGGFVDVLTRLIANELANKLGQPFVVENRAGAASHIGTNVVAHSAPDGYTLVSASNSGMVIHEFLYQNLPYDPARDFALATIFWQNPNCLFVADKHPAKTVAEFIGWAKKRPQAPTFGSGGIGATPHLAVEMFKLRTGIDARLVPYPGSTQTALAIMSGDIDFAIDSVGAYPPFLKSGQIRALAVTSEERWPKLPEVPTMAEAGVKDVVVKNWGCFAFPAATPSTIVSKLSSLVAGFTSEPSMQARFLDTGTRAMSTTPEAGTALAQAERKQWAEVIKAIGLKLE